MLIREASPRDAAAIARVHVDSWRTTYAGIVPADYLANLSYTRREQFWCDILSTPTPRAVCMLPRRTPERSLDLPLGDPSAVAMRSIAANCTPSTCLPLSTPGSRAPSHHGGGPTAAAMRPAVHAGMGLGRQSRACLLRDAWWAASRREGDHDWGRATARSCLWLARSPRARAETPVF